MLSSLGWKMTAKELVGTSRGRSAFPLSLGRSRGHPVCSDRLEDLARGGWGDHLCVGLRFHPAPAMDRSISPPPGGGDEWLGPL